MKNRAQVSLEYMTMLGLSLVIFAGVLYIATTLTSTSRTQIDVDTAYRAVQGIKELADFIYVHGHPSKIQSTIHIPGNVEDLSIEERVVRIRLSIGESFTDVYAVTKANMTGSSAVNEICPAGICTEGYYLMIFESLNQSTPYDVNITVA
ncbi:MAG: hypothetical protein DRO89_05075 [Candidatus Altiarchaeales archaeon]|nr:MAG: hypothetical protein DRO89_05075 [Candidatus Altiarchaeales archaeon]